MVPVRALIYSRVSTDAQERDGTSLDTQERACREYAQARGWVVVESIRDTASGYSLDRPGIARVRQLLRQGAIDIVVAYAVDRLSRNQNQTGVLFDEVEQAGATLEFVTEKFEDTAIGRFILAARAFVGEVEREKIAERTMRGKIERARSGRLPQGTGKGCYGYVYDPSTGKRTVLPEQAAIVKRIFTEFVSGTPTVRIVDRLNEEGIPTLTGSKWYPVTVYHMLRNEAYTGRTIYRKTVSVSVRHPGNGRAKRKLETRPPSEWIEVAGATPEIVDRETFQAVQNVLDDPERRRMGRRIHDYQLSGRVKCLKCGRAMVGQTLQGRFRYYRCRRAFAGPRHDRCPSLYVRADHLEQAIKEEAARVLANPELIITEAERLSKDGGHRERTEALDRQLRSLNDQRQRLLKLYQLGEIDDDYLRSESQALRSQIGEVEKQIGQIAAPIHLPAVGDLRKASTAVRQWVHDAQGDDLQLVLDALQVQVRVEKGHGELSGVIPEYAPKNSHPDVRSMVINPAPPQGYRFV